jgi:hypothetical protein
MATPDTNLWQSCDAATGGRLADELAERFASGHSQERILSDLRAEYGIRFSRDTLAVWVRALELKRGAA